MTSNLEELSKIVGISTQYPFLISAPTIPTGQLAEVIYRAYDEIRINLQNKKDLMEIKTYD